MNFLFSFIFSFFGLIATPDSSGWVALDRQIPYVEEEIVDKEGFWVVFSKQVGKENFSIRFPGDPIYRYFPKGIEVFSVKDSEKFHLFVSGAQDSSFFEERIETIQSIPGFFMIQAESVSADTLDLVYKVEEKWFRERVFLTSSHIYTMQTTSFECLDENHRFFIDSLYVKPQF